MNGIGNGKIINGIFCPAAKPFTFEQINEVYMHGFRLGIDIEVLNNVVSGMLNGPLPQLDLTPLFADWMSKNSPELISMAFQSALLNWMASITPPDLIASAGVQNSAPSRKRPASSANHPPDPHLIDSSLGRAPPTMSYNAGTQKRARTSADNSTAASTSHSGSFNRPLMNSFTVPGTMAGSSSANTAIPRLEQIVKELQNTASRSSNTPSSPNAVSDPLPLDLSQLLQTQSSRPLTIPVPIAQNDGVHTSIVTQMENLPVDSQALLTPKSPCHSDLRGSSSSSNHSSDHDQTSSSTSVIGETQADHTHSPSMSSTPVSCTSNQLDEERRNTSSSTLRADDSNASPRKDSIPGSYNVADWAVVLSEKLEEALGKLEQERKRVEELEKLNKKARKERKKEKKLKEIEKNRNEARKKMESNYMASNGTVNEDQEKSEREVPEAIDFNENTQDDEAESEHEKPTDGQRCTSSSSTIPYALEASPISNDDDTSSSTASTDAYQRSREFDEMKSKLEEAMNKLEEMEDQAPINIEVGIVMEEMMRRLTNVEADTQTDATLLKAEADLTNALARITVLENENLKKKEELKNKGIALNMALETLRAHRTQEEALAAKDNELTEARTKIEDQRSKIKAIQEENGEQKKSLDAKEKELNEAKAEIAALKKAAEDEEKKKNERENEITVLLESKQRELDEAIRRIEQLERAAIKEVVHVDVQTDESSIHLKEVKEEPADEMNDAPCTSAQMTIPLEYARQVRMALCYQPGKSNVAMNMWPALSTTTDQVLEDYAASLLPPRSIHDVLVDNDGLWERMDTIKVSKEDIKRCKEMRKLEDDEDEMRLLRLIAYFNQGKKSKKEVTLERIENLFRIVDHDSTDEAVRDLNEQTNYPIIFVLRSDQNTFYLKIYNRAVKVDGGLRRAVLSLVAASFEFRFEFNPEVKDVLTFFYLEAGLDDLDEPVPQYVRKAQQVIAKRA